MIKHWARNIFVKDWFNYVVFDKQAERQTSLLVEPDKSRAESSRKNYEQQQQEDKESCHHFGLDLELPHPDHYLPETG